MSQNSGSLLDVNNGCSEVLVLRQVTIQTFGESVTLADLGLYEFRVGTRAELGGH